ncbi:MAG: hypothetical protein GEU75_16515 [Dehalococcoidia bacterium]|nr:hypothetical protein [Dehalococcoidia bacterium]
MSESPLVYLLGGPMRSGKSIIAERFNRRTGISVISTDDLVHMLTLAAPQLGISDEDDGDPWARLAGESIASVWRRSWKPSPTFG